MRPILLLPFFFVLACSDETISGFADPSATYRLDELNGEAFDANATIRFPRQGVAEGDGPCNRWSAEQTVPYPWIELGPIAATRRACPELEAETSFFMALEKASLAEVVGPVLILSGDDVEMVFRAK